MSEADIIHLNQHFLIVARDVAQQDKLAAVTKFGLSEADLDALLNMTIEELMQLACSGTPVCVLARSIRKVAPDSIDAVALNMTFFRNVKNAGHHNN